MISLLMGLEARRETAPLGDPSDSILNALRIAKTLAGIDVTPEGALALSTYYACQRILAEDTAKLPFKVYRHLQPRGKEVLPTHPVYRLLQRKFNPEMDAFRGRELLTQWAVGWGNGLAEIVRDGAGRPRELYPIHPSRVRLRRAQTDNRLLYEIGNFGKEPVYLEQSSVLHIRGPGDDFWGWSVAEKGAESIGSALATQKYRASFFGNSAVPNGVLQHPAKLGPEALKNLRESWARIHEGVEQAHRPAILQEGMEWKPTAFNAKDAQLIEAGDWSVPDVCRWFRVPPYKVGFLKESAIRSNVDAQGIEYVVDALAAWHKRWEMEVLVKLFDEEREPDVFAEHLVLGLLRGDMQARANFYTQRFNLGSLSPNDIRELENENGIGPAGDQYFIPSNNLVPIDQVGRRNGGRAAEVPAATTPAGAMGLTEEAIATACRPLIAEALERMIRIEVRARARADRRYNGDTGQAYQAWLDKFVTDHEPTVRASLIPPMEALAALVWGAHLVEVGSETWERFTAEVTAAGAERHIRQLRSWAMRAGGGKDDDRSAEEAAWLTDRFLQTAGSRFGRDDGRDDS